MNCKNDRDAVNYYPLCGESTQITRKKGLKMVFLHQKG